MAKMAYRRGVPGVLPNALLIQPEGADMAPPLVAVHGIQREAERMGKLLMPRAKALGRTVVLPLFDRISWPRYQRAACRQRSDWALLELLKVLRAEGRIADGPVEMSGFSGGAQFAHRFAWLYPERVGRLCLVAPGWWTFPDARGAYPLGLGQRGADVARLQANLRRFLDREIHVAVGALDVTQDSNLRQDPDTMTQQGPHRIARARNWTAAMLRAARRTNVSPAITFREMPDCGHSFSDCMTHGDLGRDFIVAAAKTHHDRTLTFNPKFEEVA